MGRKIKEHDGFFKSSMANLNVAREFLQMHLPEPIQKLIDFEQIRVEKDSFIDSSLKKQFADVLISCKAIDGKQILVYALCEHQSKPDYWMAMRLLKYLLAICQQYQKKHPAANKLPLVYPIVFYNGLQKHDGPLNFFELFENQELAKQILHNPYKLIDASKLKLEDLQKFDWAGVMQFFMQRIWHNTLLQDLTIMSQQLKNIGLRHDGLELIKAILCYNENGIAKEQEEDLSKALSHITNEKNIEELMGTLAQSYRQEGLEQGLEQGLMQGLEQGLMQGLEQGLEQGLMQGLEQEKYNVARNLLKLGMDDQIITKATGLNLAQIAQLKKETESL